MAKLHIDAEASWGEITKAALMVLVIGFALRLMSHLF